MQPRPGSSAPGAPPPADEVTVRLRRPGGSAVELLWRRLPRAVAVVSPALGAAFAAAPPLSRRPVALLAAPIGALVIGLVVGALHPDGSDVYTSSIVVTLVLIALATVLGAGIGAWLTIGYAVGDLALGTRPAVYVDGLLGGIGAFAGLLICYGATFLLLGQVPLLATVLRRRSTGERRGRAATTIGGAVAALAAGGFAYSWSQAVPLFLRPMFVWSGGGTPPFYAVVPVQTNGLLIAGVAAAGAAVHVLLATVDDPPPDTALPSSLVERLGGASSRWVRAGLSTIAVTALFAGLAETGLDVAILVGFAAGAALLRCVALPAVPAYVRATARVPLLLRMLVAVGAGLGAGYLLLAPVYAGEAGDTQSFQPLMIGIGIGLTAGAVLLPEGSLTRRERRA